MTEPLKRKRGPRQQGPANKPKISINTFNREHSGTQPRPTAAQIPTAMRILAPRRPR
jgi:hypothetical protein